ncbi:MAG TPA: sugar phosphate isomerase/epimerase [Opitutaceae bacterium]|nr:sugar phosphate isomerase/epimerase [Opitutaceae bacterium]
MSTLGAAALLAPALARGAEPAAKTAKQPATSPMTPIAFAPRKPYIGIELYGVRGEMQKDLANAVRRVAKMGYECAEFYSPYLQWTFAYAKDVRRLLDEVGLRCLSTHNPAAALIDPGTMAKAIEMNQILGSRYLISASPPRGATGLDGWKKVAEQFATAVEELKPHGLGAGYHNHATEWKPLTEGGPRVMDVLAQNTPKEFTLQFDVGTAMESGVDPVAWIQSNPGRIRTIHLKDWAPGTREEEKSYRVLFSEGTTPWKQLIAAAESVGGVEFYLMEQEGSRYSEFETQERCLANWKKLRGAG